MELLTERLTIREIDQRTADRMGRFDAGKSAKKHLATLSNEELIAIAKEKGNLENFLADLQKLANSSDKRHFGAYLNGKLMGCITLINAHSSCPELQIEIAEQHRGQRYGYEFLRGLVHELFRQQPDITIQYSVVPSNKRSSALVYRLGSFLQMSENPVEKFFVKRYHITRLSMMAKEAHNTCSNHKPELEKDSRCGCFCCLNIYDPKEIEEWVIASTPCDYRGTAMCPHCGIDSVIGESSGYPITKEFLTVMNQMWFDGLVG